MANKKDPNIAFFFPVTRAHNDRIEYCRRHHFRVEGVWHSPFDMLTMMVEAYYKEAAIAEQELDFEETQEKQDLRKLSGEIPQ